MLKKQFTLFNKASSFSFKFFSVLFSLILIKPRKKQNQNILKPPL